MIKKNIKYLLVLIISLVINLWSIDSKKIPNLWIDNDHYDSLSYITIAKQINRGEWPDLSFRTPTYPLYLSLFTATDNLKLAVYGSAVIGAIGSMAILWIILQFTTSTVWALMGTIFIIFNLGITNYQSIILTESIAPTLAIFCLLTNLRILKNKKLNGLGIIGIIVADWLFMFLKPTFVVLPLILKLIYLLGSYIFPKLVSPTRRKNILRFGLINLFFIFSFLGYNYIRTGKAQLSTVKAYNILGKLMNYGWLDTAEYYQDAPPEVLKTIEIYNKYGRPESPYKLMNFLEEEIVLNNRQISLDNINFYLSSKNKLHYIDRTLHLIPNNFNANPEIYTWRPDKMANNPIVNLFDYIHRILNASKMYVTVLCLIIFLKMVKKSDSKSILLGSMLFMAIFVVMANSVFGYIDFGRLRQPVDILFNIFIFIPFLLQKNKRLKKANCDTIRE
jgi:hypothetical protein